MDERQLLELKEKIDEAQQEKSRLEGQRNYLLKQLKERYGVESIEEAEQALQKAEDELKQTQEQLDEALQEVEEKYDG